MTGMTAAVQREHRRRNFLPSVQGHAKYEADMLSFMALMTALGKNGIGPTAAAEIAGMFDHFVMSQALLTPEAIEADWDALASLCENMNVPKIFENAVETAMGIGPHALRQRFVQGAIVRDNLPIGFKDYIVVFSDGSHDYGDSIDEILDKRDDPGPDTALVINVAALARKIVTNAPRPLASIVVTEEGAVWGDDEGKARSAAAQRKWQAERDEAFPLEHGQPVKIGSVKGDSE